MYNANYILKGKYFWKIIILIFLFSSITLSVYSLFIVKRDLYFPIIMLVLFLVFAVLVIRFSSIKLYEKEFVICKKNILNFFVDKNIFRYDELQSVAFSKGFTDKLYLIVVAIFGSGASGGNSKADQMIITLKSGVVKIFNRFGNRKDFIKIIEMINAKIKN